MPCSAPRRSRVSARAARQDREDLRPAFAGGALDRHERKGAERRSSVSSAATPDEQDDVSSLTGWAPAGIGAWHGAGAIKRVTSGVNPQGFRVTNFNRPSFQEIEYSWLQRHWLTLPERGRIGIATINVELLAAMDPGFPDADDALVKDIQTLRRSLRPS